MSIVFDHWRARLPIVTATVLGLLLAGSAAAATVTERVGVTPTLPLGARLIGPLTSTAPLRITVVLKPRDPAALSAFAAAVSDPATSQFHHYLTPAQFAARFGASTAELTGVERSLRAAGLAPGAVSANRLSIAVRAAPAALERAFSLTLARIRERGGATAVINSLPPALAASIAPSVQAVVGLDSLGAPHPLDARPSALLTGSPAGRARAHVATGGPQPCAAATAAAPGQSAYTADQIASAYNFSGLYQAGDEGAGTTIAVYELENDDTRDIAAYQACYGTSASVSYVPVDGGDPAGAGSGEAALDIEQVIGLAPKANVIVYQGPNSDSGGPGAGPYDVLAAIVDADKAQVVTTSWGQCEAMEGSTDAHAEATLLQQAAVQGQTIVAAAGDDGSEDCDGGGLVPNVSLAVDDPGSQPFVMSAGGTSLTALGPPPAEAAWNNGGNLGALLPVGLEPGAGGGGVSSLWPMPAYQSSAAPSLGVIGTGSSQTACGGVGGYCRQVPDVSVDADPAHGYLIYYNGSGTVSGSPSGWQGIGGTSAAAPLWAALIALTDASHACVTGPVGFANPALYRAASTDYAGAFHDVTSGNNDYTNSHGGLYAAKTGYDMATGLGSPDAAALAGELCAASLRLGAVGTIRSNRRAHVRYSLGATDAAGASLDYDATGLPLGLRLNPATGVVTGSPTQAGRSTVQLEVSDNDTDVRAASFTWVIAAAPHLSALSLRSAQRGRPLLGLTFAVAKGGPAFTKLVLTLPTGLTARGSLAVRGANGHVLRYTDARSGRTLTLVLSAAATRTSLTVGTVASGGLARRLQGRRPPSLALTVQVTDGSGVTAVRGVVRAAR